VDSCYVGRQINDLLSIWDEEIDRRRQFVVETKREVSGIYLFIINRSGCIESQSWKIFPTEYTINNDWTDEVMNDDRL